MWEGDSLTVIFGLGGFALTCAIAAVSVQWGTKAKALVLGAIFFFVLLVGWISMPSAGPAAETISPIFKSLFQSGALLMVGTVSLVAIMLKAHRTRGFPNRPLDVATLATRVAATKAKGFEAPENEQSKWPPDISLVDSVRYLLAESAWRRSGTYIKEKDAILALSNSLRSGQLAAWAKEHPDDKEEMQVARAAWQHAEIKPETNYAFFPLREVAGHQVRLSSGQLKEAYPVEARR